MSYLVAYSIASVALRIRRTGEWLYSFAYRVNDDAPFAAMEQYNNA